MNQVISDAIKHYKAKASRYRTLAEKAEAEVTRLEELGHKLEREQVTDTPPMCNYCGTRHYGYEDHYLA